MLQFSAILPPTWSHWLLQTLSSHHPMLLALLDAIQSAAVMVGHFLADLRLKTEWATFSTATWCEDNCGQHSSCMPSKNGPPICSCQFGYVLQGLECILGKISPYWFFCLRPEVTFDVATCANCQDQIYCLAENDCNGHCNPGYTGVDCQSFLCSAGCASCIGPGECAACLPGFTGASCNVSGSNIVLWYFMANGFRLRTNIAHFLSVSI